MFPNKIEKPTEKVRNHSFFNRKIDLLLSKKTTLPKSVRRLDNREIYGQEN